MDRLLSGEIPDVYEYDELSKRQILEYLILALANKPIPKKGLTRRVAEGSTPLWDALAQAEEVYQQALASLRAHYAAVRPTLPKRDRLVEFERLVFDYAGVPCVTGRTARFFVGQRRQLVSAAIRIGWLLATPVTSATVGVDVSTEPEDEDEPQNCAKYVIQLKELLRWKIDYDENFSEVPVKVMLAALRAGEMPRGFFLDDDRFAQRTGESRKAE